MSETLSNYTTGHGGASMAKPVVPPPQTVANALNLLHDETNMLAETIELFSARVSDVLSPEGPEVATKARGENVIEGSGRHSEVFLQIMSVTERLAAARRRLDERLSRVNL